MKYDYYPHTVASQWEIFLPPIPISFDQEQEWIGERFKFNSALSLSNAVAKLSSGLPRKHVQLIEMSPTRPDPWDSCFIILMFATLLFFN